MKIFGYCAAALGVISATFHGVAAAQVPGTEGVTGVFATAQGEVAAYDAAVKKVRFFSVTGDTAKESRAVSVPGQVMGMVAIPEGYLVATSMGRGDLTPPIRVSKIPMKGDAVSVVYERVTERPQVTNLRHCNGTVWLGFFDSKYNTIIGKLSPPAAGASNPWTFSQSVAVRMGDSFDCLGDRLVVGRSYGDAQGQDGDLLLYQSGERTLLPSYRGVRGVRALGEASQPMVIIGDGWHPNYGEMAQGRVSILKQRKGEQRFALEILDLDQQNFNFTKFFETSIGAERAVVALASSQVIVYSGIDGQLRKQVVYTQVGKSHVLDVAVGAVEKGVVTLAIADEGLRLVQVRSPK